MVNQAEAKRLLPKLRRQFGEREPVPVSCARGGSTANALEAIAALHTDTLLVLDELSVVEPREVCPAAYQLTAGTGKGALPVTAPCVNH